LAVQLGLRGFFKNQNGSVWIEVEGAPLALEHFLIEFTGHPPLLAQIDKLTWTARVGAGACVGGEASSHPVA
jgi:hydrogenase maturation factor HypF (carbamoyltransferase family)